MAASDRILVNDRLAKPSTNLNVDDIITITFGNRTTTFQVLELKDHVRKDEANFMYKMLETSVSEE